MIQIFKFPQRVVSCVTYFGTGRIESVFFMLRNSMVEAAPN